MNFDSASNDYWYSMHEALSNICQKAKKFQAGEFSCLPNAAKLLPFRRFFLEILAHGSLRDSEGNASSCYSKTSSSEHNPTSSNLEVALSVKGKSAFEIQPSQIPCSKLLK